MRIAWNYTLRLQLILWRSYCSISGGCEKEDIPEPPGYDSLPKDLPGVKMVDGALWWGVLNSDLSSLNPCATEIGTSTKGDNRRN